MSYMPTMCTIHPPVPQAWTDDKASLNLQRRSHIVWEEGLPKNVLLVKKDNNTTASDALESIGKWYACAFSTWVPL